ncbi:multi-sensor hybrid histidine kinase : PAS/PAC sensor hybrid histidine kinase OS=Desulfococcus oleovorans (strain DSM 6200 / Hxd3) GN=Dole_1520 PE=4 SV=1: PAS_3: PAS_3: PAS_4: PAS_8: PAS_4: PAS_3: HisKA: HATPase_c: Response_reg [Gemmata massiliana]|uniref:histidine kinase n=1 Tax=Gemmata massiliana TaxID=1210884 RepID=A0A6P2CZ08_9BACT|nr:PAS domain S-box protein [Gemmata massiliana]VTR93797.1 multi-sensor hybrid histidine kinase : PAS/PAC sensor hybrid histidine kinase OS=Desulfococcus oleovorans (strain DSM 6200 / Hxd3) GN=Dole_1520 PE=4 SV=1: PAS_3: PAS_3: PAS_4: PAS_8: PAS_4: PAS_3: HisKA: HATPase_c: Response_reg [Gemmata massiliana]
MPNIVDVTGSVNTTVAEARFRALIEKSLDAVVLFDADGVMEYASPSSARLLGYDPAELTGADGFEYVHPDDRDWVRSAFASLLAEPESTFTETYRVQHKSGAWRWLEARAVNLLCDPSVGATVVTYRDVTRQHEIEDVLRVNERRFRALIENGADAIKLLSADGTILYSTPTVVGICGRTPEEVAGRNAFEWCHPDDLSDFVARYTRFLAEPGAVVSGEFRYQHKDGSWHWAAVTCTNRLRDLAVGAVVVNLRDVTARVRAETVLRAAMEGSLDAVFLFASDRGPDGQIRDFRFTDLNQRAAALIERDRAAVIGTRLCELFPLHRTAGLFDRYARVVESGEPLEEEFPLEYEGRVIWLHHQVVRTGDGVVITTRDVSARKNDEEKLRRSEDQYRRLFEASPHPMWVFDTQTLGFLAVNDAAVSQYGYTRDEFAGLTLRDIRPSEDVPALMADLGTPVTARMWRHRWKDGTVRLVEVTGHDLEYNGRPGRLVLAHDVTDRERTSATLREREELLRSVIDNIPCGVFWKDRNSVYIGCNTLFARNHALPGPEAVIGRTDLELGTSLAEAEEFRAFDRRVIETGQSVLGIEEALTRPDGSRVVLLTSKVPLRDAAGAVVGVIGVYQDITDRSRAADEVRAWKARYEAAVKAAGQVLYDWDIVTNRVEWGGSCLATLGYKDIDMPPGLAGWVALVHPDDRVAFELEAERCAVTGMPFRMEYRVRRRDGAYITVDDQGHFVPEPNGRSKRMVGFVSDVSERRRLEDQYRQAQKMDAVGQLAGGIAHDFNNLLTVINGYSDIILGTLQTHDPARSMVEEVKKAGNRAADLTRQLLAFGRQQVLQPKILDPNEIIKNVAQMLRRLIGEDIGLVLRPDPELLRVKVDPGQMSQVLMNLAVNARDAMPIGGTVTIETRNVVLGTGATVDGAEVRSGPYVRLSVTDTGTGMTAAVRRHIFEPFFTTKEQGKGTGLGLATVYGIVKQSGGHIEVETALGRGTTFRIYLPGTASPVLSENAADGMVPEGTEVILLVEDEPGVRALAELALRKRGYTVLTAGHAEEAAAVAVRSMRPVDLLLTDVVMPGTGGRALAERLFTLQPRLKVLYMSGYTDDAVVRHGVEAARVNFIQKPFTPSSLARKVREVLDSHTPSVR